VLARSNWLFDGINENHLKAAQISKIVNLNARTCNEQSIEINSEPSQVRCNNYERALQLLAVATTPSREHGTAANYRDSALPVQARVHKSLKLWSFYADLEESLGTFATCKAVCVNVLFLPSCSISFRKVYALDMSCVCVCVCACVHARVSPEMAHGILAFSPSGFGLLALTIWPSRLPRVLLLAFQGWPSHLPRFRVCASPTSWPAR
jgi:hypothetical protein